MHLLKITILSTLAATAAALPTQALAASNPGPASFLAIGPSTLASGGTATLVTFGATSTVWVQTVVLENDTPAANQNLQIQQNQNGCAGTLITTIYYTAASPIQPFTYPLDGVPLTAGCGLRLVNNSAGGTASEHISGYVTYTQQLTSAGTPTTNVNAAQSGTWDVGQRSGTTPWSVTTPAPAPTPPTNQPVTLTADNSGVGTGLQDTTIVIGGVLVTLLSGLLFARLRR